MSLHFAHRCSEHVRTFQEYVGQIFLGQFTELALGEWPRLKLTSAELLGFRVVPRIRSERGFLLWRVVNVGVCQVFLSIEVVTER